MTPETPVQTKPKSRRHSVTIPDDAWAILTDAAQKSGLSRSQILALVARQIEKLGGEIRLNA